jgi:hypothetical protein
MVFIGMFSWWLSRKAGISFWIAFLITLVTLPIIGWLVTLGDDD